MTLSRVLCLFGLHAWGEWGEWRPCGDEAKRRVRYCRRCNADSHQFEGPLEAIERLVRPFRKR